MVLERLLFPGPTTKWGYFLRWTYPGWWIRRHILDGIAEGLNEN